MIARLRPRLSLPGSTLFLQSAQDIRIGGRGGNSQFQYTVQGDSPEEVHKWAEILLDRIKTLPQIRDSNTDLQNRGLKASLVIDRDTAARLGVTPQMIDDTLYSSFGQRQVSTMYMPLNQYHVILEVEPQFQRNPDSLKDIYVRSSNGVEVPLTAFVHSEAEMMAQTINHQGQFPSVTLSFNLAPSVSLGEAVDAVKEVEREVRLPANVHASFQGTAQAFQSSLANQPWLILAALVTVYIVLGVLYESYIHPITILSTLPSAGVGALLALLITKSDLNVIALIGIILLIGIVSDHDDRLCSGSRAKGRQRASGRNLSGLFAPVPPHHDDDDGSAARRSATRARTRNRIRDAAASGNHNCWRFDGKPTFDSVHNPGGLPVSGSAALVVRAEPYALAEKADCS